MVQTRSKYRSLQNNPAAVVSEEPTQLPSSVPQPCKRKRKNDNNDEDAATITNTTITTTPSVTQSTIDTLVTQSMAASSTSSPLPDLATLLSSEAVDDALDNIGTEDKHLSEESDQEILPSDDINAGATASVTTLWQSPYSWPIEKNVLHWTKTKKGKDCLIIGNFSYIYMSESQKTNVLNLRCQRRDTKCGAVVHLDLDTRSFIDTNNVNHNHPPDRFDMKQKVLNQKIDDRIAVEPTAVLKIIERVYAEANLTDEEQLNIRLPKTAAHPKTQDFDIPIFYSQNTRGEDFVIYDGNKERFDGRLLMFSTPKLLSALFNSDIILCDGTFKTRPLLFQQVYVLMGRYHGETIPVVWCLTSCRTQSVYDAIWKKLQKIAKHMQMPWKVTKCMMDFERAVMNSFHEAFPNIDVKCCWYHFVQSLWRKIQKLGLTTLYETDPMVNTWLKQFMALPLISKGLINDGFRLLKDTMPSNDNTYHKFIKYFEKEYMKRTSMAFWHHGSNDMKTNNSLEGYNFRLLTRFGLHPSIWEFMHFLKDEEALVSHRITHLGGGSGITSSTLVYSSIQSRRKADKKQKHLLHLEDLFASKSIGLKEYLKSASFMVGKVVGQNTNTNNVDQASADVHSVEDENEDD
ncbi:unnamed protein product [Didymodactylos carnosus]|uniref:MULE transposase domain-containing protein n=1 Tax=Didymodactylos carnosus TaxID=1234261 RepID=A0A814KJA4_9BILA|nr:unnamed protein product [Didymodactylos carnosus]CAF1051594.1 unnamed protein product [Didymodactylos carnosus]CAF3593929.1 unnamed protein product [Didymodactylos carnosus]CAF3821074.1 unnamed protein product [Didymodactylos carnosus]